MARILPLWPRVSRPRWICVDSRALWVDQPQQPLVTGTPPRGSDCLGPCCLTGCRKFSFSQLPDEYELPSSLPPLHGLMAFVAAALPGSTALTLEGYISEGPEKHDLCLHWLLQLDFHPWRRQGGESFADLLRSPREYCPSVRLLTFDLLVPGLAVDAYFHAAELHALAAFVPTLHSLELACITVFDDSEPSHFALPELPELVSLIIDAMYITGDLFHTPQPKLEALLIKRTVPDLQLVDESPPVVLRGLRGGCFPSLRLLCFHWMYITPANRLMPTSVQAASQEGSIVGYEDMLAWTRSNDVHFQPVIRR